MEVIDIQAVKDCLAEVSDCEDKQYAIALLEWAIGKRIFDLAEHDKQIRADMITELKSLLRCRNYRGCAAGKGCDGVCSIDSDICKSCENFGIPYSLLEQMQKGE